MGTGSIKPLKPAFMYPQTNGYYANLWNAINAFIHYFSLKKNLFSLKKNHFSLKENDFSLKKNVWFCFKEKSIYFSLKKKISL